MTRTQFSNYLPAWSLGFKDMKMFFPKKISAGLPTNYGTSLVDLGEAKLIHAVDSFDWKIST